MGEGNRITASGFELDDDGAGLLTVAFPPEYGVAELDEFLQQVAGHFTGRGPSPFKLLVDASQVLRTTPQTRKRLGDFFRASGGLFDSACRAMSLATGTHLQQSAIQAIFWHREPTWPTKVFEERRKAEAWLAAQPFD